MRIYIIICDNSKYEHIVFYFNVLFSENECPVFQADFGVTSLCNIPM